MSSIEAIEGYFKSNIYKPLFVAVGDEEYTYIRSKLVEAGDVDIVKISKFCNGSDKKPDLDKLRETLRMADIDCQSNKIVLLGLGEYLALEGAVMASRTLGDLITFNLGSAHAVFLLRGVTNQIKNIASSDPRLSGRQIEIIDETNSGLSFMFSSLELGMYPHSGFKYALEMVEEGKVDKICVNSSLTFPESLLPIQVVKNPYEAIRKIDSDFSVPKSFGNEDEWTELLGEVTEARRVDLVFSRHGFDDTLIDFYQKTEGNGYPNWLYYIYLLCNKDSCVNPYLKYVLKNSSCFEDYKYKILNAITAVSRKTDGFAELYAARKTLVQGYPEPDIAAFISNNRIDPDESIFKLTDNTLVERQEIISDIAQHGIPKNLEVIYPDLALYLKKYTFSGDALSTLLTEYFEDYKLQKVKNVLEDTFLAKVDELAKSREYNRLRTRDELVASLASDNTFLCWIDALGVEFLSYIVAKAQKRGLAVSVSVGRADLPTITSINKKFYDIWPEERRHKIEELDDTKHNEKGGYKYGPDNQYSIHLAKELKIIDDAINVAATDLGLRKYDKYVIASDHGASRLAVLRKKEEKYETDTQGEHSGRCCKVFPNYDLPYATEENGYIVLADYGRFKKSRAANVEVHGGASLEEVVVPVITLSLRDSSIIISIVDKTIKADYKTGAEINLFVNKPITQILYVEYKGKKYQCSATDANHYKVGIPDIKRAGVCELDVYLDENLVTHISVNAVGKSASMNSDFDDLF